MDLARIIERYSKAYPRHAQGGLSALAGFDFQIRSYLADFVSALAEPRDLEAAGNELTHRLETLSDYLRQEAEQTVVVQAKRTLDGKTLKEAALEFARLDAFFEREGDGERFATLRFELVAQRGESLGWDAVGKLGGDDAKAIEIAKRFEQLRHDGRLLPVRIAPDPWWRLLAKIYPLLDDPFAFAREALDACLGIGLDLDGPARVRLQIVELFARRRRREEPALPGLLLTSEDVAFAPRTREVMVGQVPTLAHLRDGRFVDRQERVAACVAALETMLVARTPEIEAVLDTFWIDGRSGCGKSVLLLQLVRHLVEVMGQPVIWLANRSEELVPLLERWPALTGGLGSPVFVAIDDLYDRHGRQALDLHRLGSLVREAPEVAWPVLLTCGPPEFHEALKRDARGEGIHLHPWRLPPLTTNEAVAVRHWFKERTGTRGAGGNTGQPEPETLMVSLLFELRHGDLLSFASRFAERLALGGLDELLILPLALNRLYIWAPRAWLGEEGIDRLDALNRDADFAVLRAEEVTGGSLKLTHPHLSDALYQVLRKHPSSQAFTRDLARAFAKALDSAPMVASRILQVLGDGSERLAILDATTLVREVVAVWRAREGAEEVFTPDWRLMVWLNWARWAAHQPEVGAALGSPTPFERCRRALAGQPNHPAWGSVWQLLHALEPGSTELNELALDWLVVDVRGRWERPDWSFIWQTLVEGPGVTPEVSERLLRLGWQWLAGREDRSDWNFVWQSLMKQRAVLPVPITIEGLIETGMRWIAARPDRPGWAHVWKRLLELRELFDDPKEAGRLLDRGRRWLDDREDRSEWTHVWQHLLELRELFDDPKEAGRLLDRGRRWLDDREDRDEWAHVWRHLLELRELFDDPNEAGRLLDRGKRWLDDREDRNEWTHVWKRLLELRELLDDPNEAGRLLDRGRRWLDDREDRDEWAHVWKRLLDLRELFDDPNEAGRLLDRGRRWLDDREDRDEWAHVWERLLELRELFDDPNEAGRLLDRGRRWLDDREDRNEWNYVWKRLLELHELFDDPNEVGRLLDRGRRWLDGREDRNEWTFVWQKLFDHRREPALAAAGLAELGWEWLQQPAHRERGEWDKIYEAILETGYQAKDFLRAGAAWCQQHQKEPQTPPLAAKILAATSWAQEFDSLAGWLASWLQSHPQARQNRAVHWIFRKVLRKAEPNVNPDLIPGWAQLSIEISSVEPGIRKAVNEARVAEDERRLVNGRIVKRVKGGFRVSLTLGCNAFLPNSHLEGEPASDHWIGWEGPFKVLNVNPERFNVVVSRRDAAELETEKRRAEVFETLAPGQIRRGIVTNIVDYGAFVDLGGFTALLHQKGIRDGLGPAPGELFKKGQEIEIIVLTLDHERRRANLAYEPP